MIGVQEASYIHETYVPEDRKVAVCHSVVQMLYGCTYADMRGLRLFCHSIASKQVSVLVKSGIWAAKAGRAKNFQRVFSGLSSMLA